MPDKTHLNGKAEHPSFAGNMAEFTYDVVTLVELQLQLLKTDAAAVFRSVLFPAIALVFAAVLIFTSLPLLLFAGASALHTYVDMPLWAAQLSVGGGAFLLAAITGLVAGLIIRQQIGLFSRSREEFIRNVRWVKAVLKTGGSPPKRSGPRNKLV